MIPLNKLIKTNILLLLLLTGQYSFAQTDRNKDVETFYRIKSESTPSRLVHNLRAHYRKEQVPSHFLDERLEKAVELLKNDCDRITFLSVRINLLLYSTDVQPAVLLKNRLEKFKKTSACSELIWIRSKIAISNLYVTLGEIRKGREGYLEVLKSHREKGNLQGEQAIMINIGMTYSAESKPDSARIYYQASLDIYEREELEYDNNIYILMSNNLMSEGKFEKAKDYLHKALVKNAGNRIVLSYVYFNYGLLYKEQSDWTNMVLYLQDALNHSDENLVIKRDIFTVLETHYRNISNFPLAYDYRAKRDSIVGILNLQQKLAYMDSLNYADSLNSLLLEQKNLDKKLTGAKSSKNTLAMMVVISAILLLIIGYFFIRQRRKNIALVSKHVEDAQNIPEISEEDFVEVNRKEKESSVGSENSNQDVETQQGLINKFEKLLLEKKIFKDPDISIQKLAVKLKVSNDVLSKTINTHYGVSFRTLINKKRIEKAMRLLLEDESKRYSIEGIANTVGYKNMATFYNNFKAISGVTPRYFQKHGRKMTEGETSD